MPRTKRSRITTRGSVTVQTTAAPTNNNVNVNANVGGGGDHATVLVEAAVLSDVVYAAHRSSSVPGKYSKDRLSAAVEHPGVSRFLRTGWRVEKSSQDAALLVNATAGEAFVVARGTLAGSDFTRDVLANDLGLLSRRAQSTYKALKVPVNSLVKQGYKIHLCGHSLGGSVSSDVAARFYSDGIKNIDVYTFNAPDLKHDSLVPDLVRSLQKLRMAGDGISHHIRLEGDWVSLHGRIPFAARGNAHTIPNPSVSNTWDALTSPLQSHRMVNLVAAITADQYQGVDALSFSDTPPAGAAAAGAGVVATAGAAGAAAERTAATSSSSRKALQRGTRRSARPTAPPILEQASLAAPDATSQAPAATPERFSARTRAVLQKGHTRIQSQRTERGVRVKQADGQGKHEAGAFKAHGTRETRQGNKRSVRHEREQGVFQRVTASDNTVQHLVEASEYVFSETQTELAGVIHRVLQPSSKGRDGAATDTTTTRSTVRHTDTVGSGTRTRQSGTVRETEQYRSRATTTEAVSREDGFFSSRQVTKQRVATSEGHVTRKGTSALDMQTVVSTAQVVSELNRDIISRDNLLYSTQTVREQEYDPAQRLVRDDVVRLFDLSAHSKAGLSAMGGSAAHTVAHNVLSTSDGKVSLGQAAGNIGVAGAKAFATSVASSKLSPFLGDSSGHVSSTVVNSAYALAMGDRQAAAQMAFESGVNYVLEQVMTESMRESIPVSYGRNKHFTPKGLFGKDLSYRLEDAHELGVSLLPGLNVGVHFSKEQMEFKKNGFTIHHKSYGLGGHASIPAMRVGMGVRHGYEVSDVKTYERGDVTVQEQFTRTFSGQFTVSAVAGNRGGSWQIGPAWKSDEHRQWVERKTDGSPFAERSGLKNSFISVEAPTSVPTPAGGVTTRHQAAKAALVDSAIARQGRTEYDTERHTTKDTKKRYFGAKKTTKKVTTMIGEAVEHAGVDLGTTVTKDGRLVSRAERWESHSTFKDLRQEESTKRKWFSKSRSSRDYKPGQVRLRSDEVERHHHKYRLVTNADDSSLKTRTRTGKVTGGKVTTTENDMSRFEDDATMTRPATREERVQRRRARAEDHARTARDKRARGPGERRQRREALRKAKQADKVTTTRSKTTRIDGDFTKTTTMDTRTETGTGPDNAQTEVRIDERIDDTGSYVDIVRDGGPRLRKSTLHQRRVRQLAEVTHRKDGRPLRSENVPGLRVSVPGLDTEGTADISVLADSKHTVEDSDLANKRFSKTAEVTSHGRFAVSIENKALGGTMMDVTFNNVEATHTVTVVDHVFGTATAVTGNGSTNAATSLKGNAAIKPALKSRSFEDAHTQKELRTVEDSHVRETRHRFAAKDGKSSLSSSITRISNSETHTENVCAVVDIQHASSTREAKKNGAKLTPWRKVKGPADHRREEGIRTRSMSKTTASDTGLLLTDRTEQTTVDVASFVRETELHRGVGDSAVLGKSIGDRQTATHRHVITKTTKGGLLVNSFDETTDVYIAKPSTSTDTTAQVNTEGPDQDYQFEERVVRSGKELSMGGQRGVGVLAGGITSMALERIVDGKAVTATAASNVVVDTISAVGQGTVAHLATIPGKLAAATGAGAAVLGATAVAKLVVASHDEADMRDKETKAVDTVADAGKGAMTMAMAATEGLTVGKNLIKGTALVQAASCATDLATTIYKAARGKITKEEAIANSARSMAGACGSAVAGWALTQAAGEAALGALATTGLLGSIAAVALPAAICAAGAFVASKIVSKVLGWFYDPKAKEKKAKEAKLKKLLAKYKLSDTSDRTIARAYRRRAVRCHPDKGGSPGAFQALSKDFEEMAQLLVATEKKSWVSQNRCSFMAFFYTVVQRAHEYVRQTPDKGDVVAVTTSQAITQFALEGIDKTNSGVFREWQEKQGNPQAKKNA
eukprot:m.203428 g.203428  ORF g.203428 m.203428 type:complete len:1907 (-) comp18454_c1_seq4:10-5730(-)